MPRAFPPPSVCCTFYLLLGFSPFLSFSLAWDVFETQRILNIKDLYTTTASSLCFLCFYFGVARVCIAVDGCSFLFFSLYFFLTASSFFFLLLFFYLL